MTEGQLLAMLHQAEDRLRQLEYRLAILENAAGSNTQLLGALRSASAN